MIFRVIIMIILTSILSACMAQKTTPEQQAATQANIERNRMDPEKTKIVETDNGTIQIKRNSSNTIAMVNGIPGVTTIADMEQAVQKETNCNAEAPTNLPNIMGISKTQPLQISHYKSFAGAIPIRILC